MNTVYIVNETAMDSVLINLPPYISGGDSGLGYGMRAIKLHTDGVMIQDGINAVLAIYPNAKVTAERSQAHAWCGHETTWGGVRAGAGRKTLTNEPAIEATVNLPASLDAKAKRLGDGNRSAGIRKALEAITE